MHIIVKEPKSRVKKYFFTITVERNSSNCDCINNIFLAAAIVTAVRIKIQNTRGNFGCRTGEPRRDRAIPSIYQHAQITYK